MQRRLINAALLWVSGADYPPRAAKVTDFLMTWRDQGAGTGIGETQYNRQLCGPGSNRNRDAGGRRHRRRAALHSHAPVGRGARSRRRGPLPVERGRELYHPPGSLGQRSYNFV